MSDVAELKQKLSQITQEIKLAVDLTVELRREFPQHKDGIIKLWEDFLGQLFSYIKQKSKDSKDNLLAGISLTRMKLF